MLSCPKCGSARIGGPVYRRDGFEYLRYWCERCGYTKNEPTLDEQRSCDLDSLLTSVTNKNRHDEVR